jgi:hypothetical protein
MLKPKAKLLWGEKGCDRGARGVIIMQSLKSLTMLLVMGHATLQKQSDVVKTRDVMLSPTPTHFFVPSNLESKSIVKQV